MKNLMLKKLRVVVSITIFTLLTFYFLDFAGILPVHIHALGCIQFIPALLSHSVAIIVFLIICVSLFGRVYCSFICPMGIFQDIINRCSKGKQKKFAYRKNNPVLRWSIVAISLTLFLSGFTLIIGMLDPYSMYGRIAVHIFKPVYMLFNNALAYVFNHFGNYAFYRTEVAMLSIFSFIVALLSFAVVGALAWAKGRLYCNTICPVGTIFGFINKFSLFKIRINSDKCASCGLCANKCKALCIDAKARAIDYSRCVNCFNCLNNCNKKAISFAVRNKQEIKLDKGKRKFLLAGLTAAIAAPAVFAQTKIGEFLGEKKERQNAISPPGAVSTERLLKHCSSCHLCVSKCPSNVLKPAFMEYGAGGMMMPLMYFEKGFCNFDCTICADVCPNKALTSLTVEQKHRLQVGQVVFVPELCVVHTEGTSCGACSEHCPTQAVKMVPYKDGLTIPFIDAAICVGCGGCEFICPVRPHRAIYVEGNKIHKQAKAFDVEKKETDEITDFGF
jgi:ferredoxin